MKKHTGFLLWLTVQEVSSSGRSHRIYSHKTGRVYHLLSDLELAVFLSLEWESSVLDIREQFAIQVKPAAALQDERTLEKLELERRYWQQKQIPWFIFTSQAAYLSPTGIVKCIVLDLNYIGLNTIKTTITTNSKYKNLKHPRERQWKTILVWIKSSLKY